MFMSAWCLTVDMRAALLGSLHWMTGSRVQHARKDLKFQMLPRLGSIRWARLVAANNLGDPGAGTHAHC